MCCAGAETRLEDDEDDEDHTTTAAAAVASTSSEEDEEEDDPDSKEEEEEEEEEEDFDFDWSNDILDDEPDSEEDDPDSTSMRSLRCFSNAARAPSSFPSSLRTSARIAASRSLETFCFLPASSVIAS